MQTTLIWVIGWHRVGTGFTRVLEQLCTRFAEHASVRWFGIGEAGEPRLLAERIWLEPVRSGRGDPVGAYLAASWLSRERPSLIFCLNDLWYLEHYARVLGPRLQGIPMFGYLPLDGAIPDDLVLPDLRAFRALLTYTEVAADELRRALSRNAQAVPVAVAGHGVDHARFAPDAAAVADDFSMNSRMRLAQALFALPSPSIVILNASRPDPRKRIDLSIDAFALLAQRTGPALRLCLHHAIAHDDTASRLRARAEALGIADRLICWPPQPGALSDAELNRLYNACAIGLNSSVGEGFGLVSFEHAATAAPQVLPDHPALRELWGDAATRVGPVSPQRTEHSPLIMAVAAAPDVAAALAALVHDPAHYRDMAKAAYRHAHNVAFDWAHVARQIQNALMTAAADPSREADSGTARSSVSAR